MLLAVLALAASIAAAPVLGSTPGAVAPAGAEQQADTLLSLDPGRLPTDRAYAQTVLRDIDRALPGERDVRRRLFLETVRTLALAGTGRLPEAKAAIERLATADHPSPDDYVTIMGAATILRDATLTVRSIEGIARRLGSNDPTRIFELLEPRFVWWISGQLRDQGLADERARLAQALISMGWRRSERGPLEGFRHFLIGHRLGEGRRAEAAELAREVSSASVLMRMLVARRYDGILPGAEQNLQALLEEEDRGTASALRATPGEPEALVRRMHALRSAGRNAEVVELARPFLADVGATVATGEHGSWIVNDAVYALLATGRADEAAELMGRLNALDPADYAGADLISTGINYAGLLWEIGRPADSLAQIARLRSAAANRASDYGRAWIAAYAVCSHYTLEQAAQAQTDLAWLKERPAVNAAALNLALLCANDLDASERHVINRLQSDDPDEILMALQDYAIVSPVPDALAAMERRFAEVRDRPAVRAAVARVGQIRTLPVARVYHGTF